MYFQSQATTTQRNDVRIHALYALEFTLAASRNACTKEALRVNAARGLTMRISYLFYEY